jgi:2,4-dienoyl-CoA reductase-like NADH-dependent reductase (Old Yellow Enzyme family)
MMTTHEKFHFKSAAELRSSAVAQRIDLPWSESVAPLFLPATVGGVAVPNRLVVQPMEGFDCDADGTPGELAFRRYGRYAAGGSGMIWFEACSVVPDGRSNPHQMMLSAGNVHVFKELTSHIREVAVENYGVAHRPFLVLQLTHSGRYSHPQEGFKAKFFSDNPVLGRSEEADYYSDIELDEIKSAFIGATVLAREAGFDAVDIKACHGYLLHEMLFAYDRTDSRYGGDFEGRTRFMREVLNHSAGIMNAVRLSAFDLIPYPYGFGMNPDGSLSVDLSEVKRLIGEFAPLVPLWNITAGVPKHNSYVGRPFDRGVFNGAPPDEHPLTGIGRLIGITGELQSSFPDLQFVGTAYSWLRHYYPFVGAGVLEQGKASFIGLGRGSFAYPDSPKDLMNNGLMDPKKTCTSCSKCTEFMRLGVATGCAVRDPAYKVRRQKAKKAGLKEYNVISK